MDPILREIIVFSIALTLPTYFVRGIDKIPALFKRIKFEGGRWFRRQRAKKYYASKNNQEEKR